MPTGTKEGAPEKGGAFQNERLRENRQRFDTSAEYPGRGGCGGKWRGVGVATKAGLVFLGRVVVEMSKGI